MRFEWDERKRQANILKHGLDFRDASHIFSGGTATVPDDREDYGERRFITLGSHNGTVVVVAHTETTDVIRIISMRKATKDEEDFYFKEVGNKLEEDQNDEE